MMSVLLGARFTPATEPPFGRDLLMPLRRECLAGSVRSGVNIRGYVEEFDGQGNLCFSIQDSIIRCLRVQVGE